MLTILNWVVIGDDSQMMTLHEHELEPPPCYRLAHIVSLFIMSLGNLFCASTSIWGGG
jgi:hypothetical protein